MITTLLALASAGPPTLHDVDDAAYLERTGRHEAAASWYLEHLDEHLTQYVDVLGMLPEQRSAALVAQVEQWRQTHPDDGDAIVALAMAHSYADLTPWTWTSPFGQPGRWCGPAQEALQTLPADPSDRYRVLRARIQVARRCGGATDEDEAAQEALALSGDAGPYLQGWFGLRHGIDDVVLQAVEEGIDERPARIGRLTHAFADDAEGPALQAVRDLLLAHARTLATTDRPAHVAGAIAVLAAADLEDEARAAREHLKDLDPENKGNLWALEERPPRDDDGTPEASTLLDPAERLAALQAQSPPANGWQRTSYWASMADAAEATGDADTELRALEKLVKLQPTTSSWLRYARATARTGRNLTKGAKAVDKAIDGLRDPRAYRLPSAGDEAGWRDRLAEALDVRAALAEARGQKGFAADDLEEAMLLTGPTPERLLQLASFYSDDLAAPLLARALVELPDDDPRVDAALARITAWLGTQPGWQPDAATYVTAFRPDEEEPVAKPPLDGRRFVDLTVQIDGEDVRLFDIEGPIVLDVWATWCGPCKQSLPHLDTLARRFDGEVTFVAVSVDAELATAERYLARRGDAAFTSAFLGADGMEALGVTGIPALFVFDGDHRLVAQLSGFGPGSTALDEAVDEVLAGR